MENQEHGIDCTPDDSDDKKKKLNAFELLMNSSLSSIKNSAKKAKRKRRQSVQSDGRDADADKANADEQKFTPIVASSKQNTNSLNRSRSQTPEIIDISSSNPPSDEENNVEDGIIGMKVRSTNTSRCSVAE